MLYLVLNVTNAGSGFELGGGITKALNELKNVWLTVKNISLTQIVTRGVL